MMKTLLLCLLCVTVCSAQVVVNVQNVTAKLGEDISIPCTYEVGVDTDIEPQYKWYRFEHDGEEERINSGIGEDGTLTITGVSWEDQEMYYQLACEVSVGQIGETRSVKANFSVISLPGPDINATVTPKGDSFPAEANALIAICRTPGSVPTPEIMFYKNGVSLEEASDDPALDALLFAGTELPDPTDTEGKRKVLERDFYKVLDKSDHQAQFSCKVTVRDPFGQGQVLYERDFPIERFNVEYETDMAEWAEEPNAYLGATVKLTCNANGYPAPNIMINGEDTNEKEFVVTSNMNGQTYECSAWNFAEDNAVKSSVFTINVMTVEVPTITGGNGTIKEGMTATFTCTSSGNPEPSVAWYKEDAMVADSGTLTITEATLEDSADFTCRAFVDGHESLETRKDFHVAVQGLRIDGEEEEQKEGKKDETVVLVCGVFANPKPTFTWDIEDADATETWDGYMYTSQVQVGPLTPELSEASYQCTATAPEGTTVVKTFKLPEIARNVTSTAVASASGATTGAIIAILLVILIVAIILAVLYNKGIICKKQEKGDESADEDIAVVNNEDGDVEAGNGKAATAQEVEEQEPVQNAEEEKLMNGEEIEK